MVKLLSTHAQARFIAPGCFKIMPSRVTYGLISWYDTRRQTNRRVWDKKGVDIESLPKLSVS